MRRTVPVRFAESDAGSQVLKLLSHRPGSPPASPKAGESPEPSTSSTPHRDYLTVDVLPPDAPWPPAASSSTPMGYSSFRPLRTIDNTVTFRSVTAVYAESRCQIHRNGQAIYSETTQLNLQQSSCVPATYATDMECLFLYSTQLVPGYWDYLCKVSGEISSSTALGSSRS